MFQKSEKTAREESQGKINRFSWFFFCCVRNRWEYKIGYKEVRYPSRHGAGTGPKSKNISKTRKTSPFVSQIFKQVMFSVNWKAISVAFKRAPSCYASTFLWTFMADQSQWFNIRKLFFNSSCSDKYGQIWCHSKATKITFLTSLTALSSQVYIRRYDKFCLLGKKFNIWKL